MLIRLIYRAIKAFVMVLFVSLVLCVIAQVFFRYVMKISVPWTEEAARVLAVWVTIIGIVLIEHDDAQIRTTYFVSKLKPNTQKIWHAIIVLLSVYFIILFLVGSFILFDKTSNVIMGSIPYFKTNILYLPALISLPLAIIFILLSLKTFKKFEQM